MNNQYQQFFNLTYRVDESAISFFSNVTGLQIPAICSYIEQASVLKTCLILRKVMEGKKQKEVIPLLILSANSFLKDKNCRLLPSSEKRFRETLQRFENNGALDYSYLLSGKLNNQNAKKQKA